MANMDQEPATFSGGTGQEVDEIDIDNYTDTELEKLHDELAQKNDILDMEVILFESYFQRVQPQLTAANALASLKSGTNPTEANAAAWQDYDNENDGKGDKDKDSGQGMGRRDKKKRNEKAKESEKPLLLTSEQKAEIAARELEELKDLIDSERQEWEKESDNLKVSSRGRMSAPLACFGHSNGSHQSPVSQLAPHLRLRLKWKKSTFESARPKRHYTNSNGTLSSRQLTHERENWSRREFCDT
jgi:hypothetical protein